ncbi:polysaccharide lyase 6 family protein [Gayadomonas joobiniege]|uniref:polysaccharide lyase 6 family protein n=1 Tax=Gayadomonas joobiniege TaxID=1234606 RepID=UPI0003733000|nr:polysaccharide lyase 6 family protein [Gayadomonas joobiniege]
MKIASSVYLKGVFAGACLLGWGPTAYAEIYQVADQAQYKKISENLQPGDEVVLKNGVWKDFEIVFRGQGTKDEPIVLRPENNGDVILTGQSNLRLAGEHLLVKGLVFKEGYTPTSEVISFRYNNKELAYHSRVTEVVIDNYSNPDKFETDYWVALYGQHNRFDHSFLRGKRNRGVTLAVRLNSSESQQNHHQIDHNYFGPRPTLGSNGGETLRVGTSHYSLTDSYTRIENNYFDRCNGEVEIISIKSGKNIIKNNLFFESTGTLTLRHGNQNTVESNIFFGNGKAHTGGIRVINQGQKVVNNYLEGLTGFRFGSGLTVMNGVPNSPINRYHQVKDALIQNNTLINVENIHLAAGADSERSAAPVDSNFSKNLIVNQSQTSPFEIFDDISGIEFADNLVNFDTQAFGQGFSQTQYAQLKRDNNGLYYLPGIEQGARIERVLQKSETGPAWYSKKDLLKPLNSGKSISVASGSSLADVIASADSGDTLVLAAGDYTVSRILQLDKAISIRGEKGAEVTLYPQRGTLFEIQNKGSLALYNLTINGAKSPDSTGNVLIRTKKWGMYYNYKLLMDQVDVRDLDVNKAFDFFAAGARSLADEIRITNSRFSNISGGVLLLNKETDDLGIYNAEYVTLENNQFSKVQDVLLDLYRGGRDESTFGPHLSFQHNKVFQVANGKRNKTNASLRLHGVQQSLVAENQFVDSAKIVVEHTVGDPNTVIKNNLFKNTAKPEVKELVFEQAPTAILNNNRVE